MVGQQKKGLAMQTAADRPKHRPRFSDSRIWDVMYSTPFLGGSQLVGFAERRIEAGAPKPYGKLCVDVVLFSRKPNNGFMLDIMISLHISTV